MKNSIQEEQEIISALQDSGMDRDMINEFITYFRSEQKDEEKQMLLSFRAQVLDDVHVGQNKLYCIDFLINQLKLK
ncbi:TPA: hypothetical protein ACKPEE_000169 [Listeria monocytogenes]